MAQQPSELAVRFIERMLAHTKAPHAGKPFVLRDWQREIVRELLRTTPDGHRQYRTALIGIPRKNGKTQLIAALVLYFLLCGETGGEIYVCAGDRDQARRVFGAAKDMLRMSPQLSRECRVLRDRIEHRPSGSVLVVRSAEAYSAHGLNPTVVIFDELWNQPSRDMWTAMTTGSGTREDPLHLAITTAGHDRNSLLYELYEYGRTANDPTFYFKWYGAGEDDDWTDRDVWHRANPALGDFLRLEELETEFRAAQRIPARQNEFRQWHLNQWTQQESRWIDMDVWRANGDVHLVDEAALIGQPCWGGLDLSAVSDITALIWAFPCASDSDAIDIVTRLWLPEDTLTRHPNATTYRAWHRAGLLNVTPGNLIDYRQVGAQVIEDAKQFHVQALNVDTLFQGAQLASELQEGGINVASMRQGHMSMAAPMVEFERMLLGRRIHHANHAALAWQANHVQVIADAAGNLKIDRSTKRREKVDAIVALVMALDARRRHGVPPPSIYEHPNFHPSMVLF